LLVPNIKEAQDLSLVQLAHALDDLTLTAREGKTSTEDQSNGTITITNIGVFGMDTGTPILNRSEEHTSELQSRFDLVCRLLLESHSQHLYLHSFPTRRSSDLLLVPNIKEAQDLSLVQLAHALDDLTLTAREGKTSTEDQSNGTITITNIGVFGMDTGTPILN